MAARQVQLLLAELQQAMAMMQTLKARQEQQERELAMNLPEDESGALSEMLAQQQVAAQPSTDLRTDGYFPAPTEDPEAEDSEDDFDIEELRSKAETPEQLQLLAMMEELLQQRNVYHFFVYSQELLMFPLSVLQFAKEILRCS